MILRARHIKYTVTLYQHCIDRCTSTVVDVAAFYANSSRRNVTTSVNIVLDHS